MNIGTVAQGNGIPMPSFEMSPEEKARLNMEVDTINKQNFPEGRKPVVFTFAILLPITSILVW